MPAPPATSTEAATSPVTSEPPVLARNGGFGGSSGGSAGGSSGGTTGGGSLSDGPGNGGSRGGSLGGGEGKIVVPSVGSGVS